MQYFSRLIFIIAIFFLPSESNGQDTIDSLRVELNKHKAEDTIRVNLMLELYSFLRSEDIDEAREMVRKVRDLSQKLNYSFGLMHSWAMEGELYYYERDYERAYQIWREGLQVAKVRSDEWWQSQLNILMGELLSSQDTSFYAAIDHIHDGLLYAEHLQDIELQISGNMTMGLAYTFSNEFTEAAPFFRKAYILAKKIDHLYYQTRNLSSLSEVMINLKHYDSAKQYSIQCLNLSRITKDNRSIAHSMRRLGSILRIEKNFDSALYYAFEALRISQALGDKSLIGSTNILIGKVYIGLKMDKLAKHYLERGVKYASSFKSNQHLSEAYSALYELNKGQGNYRMAVNYLELFKSKSDSINEVQKKRNLAKMEMNFQLDLKEEKLKEAEAKSMIQELELAEQQVILAAAVAAMILIVLSALVIYYLRNRYLKKIKAFEIQYKLKEERDRIAHDLHDNLGSQLSSISIGINRLAQENNKGDVQTIQDMADNAIAELRNSLWVMDKESISISELEQRINGLFWQYRKIEVPIDLQVNVEEDLLAEPLTSIEAGHLYRIIQEAAHNSIKHSCATHFKINFEKSLKDIQVTISDNGIGFDPKINQNGEHYGMKNMTLRAEQMNAKLTVEAGPSNGVKIVVRLPTKS